MLFMRKKAGGERWRRGEGEGGRRASHRFAFVSRETRARARRRIKARRDREAAQWTNRDSVLLRLFFLHFIQRRPSSPRHDAPAPPRGNAVAAQRRDSPPKRQRRTTLPPPPGIGIARIVVVHAMNARAFL